jgi:hypothetical protein
MQRSFFHGRLVGFAAAAAIGATACSGAQPSDLFDPDGSISVGPDAGPADVVPPPPVDGGRDVGNPPPPKDAGRDVEPPDSGSKTSPIACSNAGACSAPKEVCCRTQLAFMSYSYACTSGAACMGAGTLAIPCDDANDCAVLGAPGQVCCAELISTGQTLVASKLLCKPPGQCTLQSTPTGVVVCDPKDPNACAGGQSCQLSMQTLPGYYICRN